jgi:hypothetical protein
MKYGVFIIIASICFVAGRLSVDRAPIDIPSAHSACREMDSFRGDFVDYHNLKLEAEKLKKADEILGKIMTVFLADLALRLKPAESANRKEPYAEVSSTGAAVIHQPTSRKKDWISLKEQAQ